MQTRSSRHQRRHGAIAGALAAATLLLGSCGGSSSYTAGIDGSGVRVVAEGPIEAFGSIVVGGDHYELSGAVIRINGEIAAEDDLALGQVVIVQGRSGTDGNAFADTVDFEANLLGPVQSVDAAGDRFIVLGQQVRVDASTTLDLGAGATLEDLSLGDRVEVSGLAASENRLYATRIQRADVSAGLRIVGIVDDPDLATFRFEIGDLIVDYRGAGLIDGFPGGAPADGDRVLALGDALDGAGALIATRLLLLEADFGEHEGDEAEVEGFITRFVSVTDFDVAGRRSTTTSETRYEGGSVADLALNAKIQIEGHIDSAGTIVAGKIEVKD